jgi:hypothetical protein
MKMNFTKGLLLCCWIVCFGFIAPQKNLAQCLNNNTLYNISMVTSEAGDWAQSTTIWGGDYVNFEVCAGATYLFSTCGTSWDSQITLYDSAGNYLAYDDDGCNDGITESASELQWTATVSGIIRVVIDLYNCTSNSTNGTLTIYQLTDCPIEGCTNNNTYYGDMSTAFAGDSNTLNNVWGGDYYTMDVCNGANYTVSMCGTTWDSQITLYDDATNEFLLYDDDGCGSFAGASYMNFTPNYDGTIDIVIDAYPCVSNQINGTLTVTQNTACAATCSVYNTDAYFYQCWADAEEVSLYVDFIGACGVEGVWIYTLANGWNYTDLSDYGYGSGSMINFYLYEMSTEYQFEFVLSDGTVAPIQYYSTGACVSTCSFTNSNTFDMGCSGDAQFIDFYAYYTGDCSVYSIWVYTALTGWTEIVLNGTFYSGDAIPLMVYEDNTLHTYYYVLNDGTESINYSFISGNCQLVSCTNLSIDYINTGCIQTAGGSYTPSGTIIPSYNGGCSVAGVYSSVNGGAYMYLDLSAYGFTSGDLIDLYFNVQDAVYSVYYVLDDGTESVAYTFITDLCLSGETICDCAGTQLPIEATGWLGDGFQDNGTYYWGGDLTLPVNFNCATWGFDCGDGAAAGDVFYDPYGVCSGFLPPANGCVDELCYNIDIDVTTDCFPLETGVNVYNAMGALVMTIPAGDFVGQDTYYVTSICLPAGCYTFEITDSYGDGMSSLDCAADGWFGVWDWSTNQYVIYADGSSFAYSYSSEFCPGPQTFCNDLTMEVFQEDCASYNNILTPHVTYTFDFDGPCTVETLYISLNGGEFTPLDLSAYGYGSGDTGNLFNLAPNSEYVIYYVTNDGAASFLYAFNSGNCNNEIQICDCDGTQHSIGVTQWLGDNFADNGFYQWAGQYVNFNCSTWGYDCGDIAGSPSIDPYNVCGGGLPPFNGCIDVVEVLGCTDPLALNYNPQATINNGSCIYNLAEGCMDQGACNYNASAIFDDGSCEYITCAGCTDSDATNYDNTATIDDGSCSYEVIEGCTDANALNYNPLASVNDGSCVYTCIYPNMFYQVHCQQGDLDNFYVDVEVAALGNGAPYTITNNLNNQQQVMSLPGSFTMGPFANNTQVVIAISSNNLDCFLTSAVLTENCSGGGIYGCTDPLAINFNPDATIDDGSCVYPGVEEAEGQAFQVYPNPTRESINIANTSASGFVSMDLFDQIGRVVLSKQLTFENGVARNIDLSAYAAGKYVVRFTSDVGVEHHQIIIQQ